MFRNYRLSLSIITAILLSVALFTLWANHIISTSTNHLVTNDISKIGVWKTGLLLGTSKYLAGERKNDYFFYRIEAAVELYRKGAIRNIIISGDNSTKDYNEPLDMKRELVNNGIPDSVIYLDYAGFRTLDAVVRAKAIFGQDSLVVISQQFHNERAIFIALKNGITACGYNAKDVRLASGFMTKVREYFARDKVFIDDLFGVEPKFYGEKIIIR